MGNEERGKATLFKFTHTPQNDIPALACLHLAVSYASPQAIRATSAINPEVQHATHALSFHPDTASD